MRSFVLLGFLLQVLFVLSYPESIKTLERRDLSGLQSINPQQLFKRSTSRPNPVVCPNGDKYDLNDYNKALTALVQRKVKCVYYSNLAMVVFDQDGNPATFTDSEPSTIRNWYDSQISQQCETQRPVRVRSKQPPLRPDDSLSIGTAFFNDYAADKQVVNCDDEDDAYIRNYLASF
ncbi:uncharacterized protein MELLADRAFT_123436 [Melampsora larici-populina 98AG31]|uniref:Secreted protein n=1 Tax=Melampsora larici-populina (strain 98AG31 / pathotype 3-4-7) TaxID=747676 RepID=F4RAU7_MELLP|nr:uncharacterized protein MELLADRAFT_123436 [Melampsora larici-populina 98AG31]EGG10538.1 secreted protein [Melampsora larici-populina 98AG31]